MASQLFKVRPVDIPYSVTMLLDGKHISSQHVECFPYMYWPGGGPCAPLNMYFMDIAYLTTGQSLKTIASELSHLVRYCGTKNVPISALQDANIFELSTQLQNEKCCIRISERARNDNTVRAILSRTIRFLLWYQDNFFSAAATPLIGEINLSPQIIIKRLKGQTHTGHRPEFYYTHRAMPTPESREPKRPIALPIIEAIEQCVDSLSDSDAQPVGFVQRYRNRPELLSAHLEYMRNRRHFMIWLMKRTGLRPSEMVEIDVKKHRDILHSKIILIPTKKRRRERAPLRSFPITLKDATVFQRYLIARTRYCSALECAGQDAASSDALFLSVDGTAVKKSSLERDFSRLVTAAGFHDVQTCFSMFRHRFITYEVIVHLKEFMTLSGKTSQLMTHTDYESILKRVSVKTGHGSVKSLWHYIDLAWEEINVWGGVDKAIERLHAADRLHDELLNLKRELETMKRSTATAKLIGTITGKIAQIINSGKQDIERGSDF
ncbi:hypothetical protein R69776_03007 [Paraburkholderia nemoris]|uniref:Tyr recombinase domain-containing protein n=2 Tax=Paraburkholderia nemoris TaxID=2793076 RepID=A0ABM8RH28_9BURK|nr:hypothetical protein R69776_03007 [Paraburkholderia nemoris]CAE6830368.1 hypothetical protein R75777_06571 [Paraburkholderia nemoris]